MCDRRPYGLILAKATAIPATRHGKKSADTTAGSGCSKGGYWMPSDRIDEFSHPSKERRTAARYRFSADIEIQWCAKRVWGRVRDVSRNGMFIELPDQPVLNAAFSANLALNEPLRVECVVRRIVPERGVGVSITIAEEQARKRFAALLFALGQGAGPATKSVSPPTSNEPPSLLVASVA